MRPFTKTVTCVLAVGVAWLSSGTALTARRLAGPDPALNQQYQLYKSGACAAIGDYGPCDPGGALSPNAGWQDGPAIAVNAVDGDHTVLVRKGASTAQFSYGEAVRSDYGKNMTTSTVLTLPSSSSYFEANIAKSTYNASLGGVVGVRLYHGASVVREWSSATDPIPEYTTGSSQMELEYSAGSFDKIEFYATGGLVLVNMNASVIYLALSAAPVPHFAFVPVNNGVGELAVIDTADPAHPIVAHVPCPASELGNCSPRGAVVTHDGKSVFVTDWNGLVYRADTSQLPGTVHSLLPISFVWQLGGGQLVEPILSPDEKILYVTGNRFGTLAAFDTATNQLLGNVSVHNDYPVVVWGGEISPDGKTFYAAAANNRFVQVVDVSDPAHMAEVASIDLTPYGQYYPYNVRLSKDGSKLYATSTEGTFGIVVIATSTRQVVSFIPTDQRPRGIGLSADGKTLYTVHLTGNQGMSIIDLATNTVVGYKTFQHPGNPSNLAITGDGSEIYVTRANSGDVFIVETADLSYVARSTNGQSYGFGKFAGAVGSGSASTPPPPPSDSTPPVIAATVSGTLGSNGWYTSNVTVSWTVTDPESAITSPACAGGTVSSDTAGTIFTCSATSGGGTTVAAPVTIKRDATPPSMSVPASVVAEATGPSGAVVNYPAATASDSVSGVATVGCVPASGSTFAPGSMILTCTATDGAGNSTTGTFSVTVRDTTPPVLSGVPANVTVNATMTAGAVVTYTLPTASDVVGGAIVPVCAPASGSTFGVGTTTVTCTATDAALNATSATFTVTVRGASPMLADLLALVSAVSGPGNSLPAKVQAARASLAAGNTASAASSLQALLREVSAQTGKKLTAAQGASITALTKQILAVLGY